MTHEISAIVVRKLKVHGGGKWRVEACFGPSSIYNGLPPEVLNSHKHQRDAITAAHALGRFLGVRVVVYTNGGYVKSSKDYSKEYDETTS